MRRKELERRHFWKNWWYWLQFTSWPTNSQKNNSSNYNFIGLYLWLSNIIIEENTMFEDNFFRSKSKQCFEHKCTKRNVIRLGYLIKSICPLLWDYIYEFHKRLQIHPLTAAGQTRVIPPPTTRTNIWIHIHHKRFIIL